MKKKLFSVFAGLFALGLSTGVLAQGKVTGLVVDADTQEPLIGAAVYMQDNKGVGTVTQLDGTFQLEIADSKVTLVFDYLGYINLEKSVAVAGDVDLGTIELKSSSVGIVEVSVIANVAVQRKTPVALSSIKPQLIEEKLGTQEFPEILKSTPGIYATKQGGGFGDSRINVRGFDMNNTAVMINGIPVNDMENGWVYWSNWAGLSEVTRSMQVQRGLGASKLSIGSVGGTINVLTKTTDAEKGGSAFVGIGNDGYFKRSFTVSTGLTDNDWAVTFSGAHTTGQGWVDATQFDSWSYFLSISKRWDNQILSFTVFGAPQTHGQRSSRQYITDMQDPNKGLKYNPDWGYLNGETYNLRTNFYHKPQMSLNHYWTISDKTMLSTSAYASFGTGGGTGNYGSEGNKFYDYIKDGQIDFDRIVDENIANGGGGSTAILRSSRNDHTWIGLLSNLQHKLTENLEISGGIDLRYYKGEHFREVTDLLGGEFVLSDDDVNNPNKIARTGDKIGYYNDGLVSWQGVFAQAEYTLNDLNVFVSGAFNNMGQKRIDYFSYTPDEQETDWVNHQGFVVKGGANYNIDEHHNVFGNLGYFERTPFFDNVFVSNSNEINEGAKNEKTMAFEIGYGYKSRIFSANINAYYTNWKDKFFRLTRYTNSGDPIYANISGVNALHKGIEADFVFKPIRNMVIRGMASLGDWRWQNNLTDVPIFDDNQNVIDEVSLYIKDLKVADAAQTTAAIGIDYTVLEGLKVGMDYVYNANIYAAFDPTGRGDENEAGVQPWEMPDYGLVDANVNYRFKIGQLDATVYGNINNIFNTEYISDANDGSGHNWQSALVYYGFGRTWSTGLRVNF
ncbi:TonB-dependent receptor [Carboxylicivirga linearis]|uniref:TonB-dependent receptor n=1 Tax=Carboxylicivirga linearis TaxID=1628157 RepID=A0ABS5JRJ5_9BACT|nr:TonB-dependent receptor [Carboxylicivirga linearis]MBS2097528.1 TonB-dependent receptor [Carboxylicivirga linearis]